MELNELKLVWAEYDKILSEKLKLNEEILRSIHFEKYSDSLRKPAGLEMLNIIIQTVMAMSATYCAISLSNETLYLTTGLAGAVICILSLVLSGIKVSLFNKLLGNEGGIIGYQRDLMHLRLLIMRLRIVEHIIAPLLVMTLLPVLVKATTGIDLINDLKVFIPLLMCSGGFGFAIGTLLNRKIYDKGISDAHKFLAVIERFEKES